VSGERPDVNRVDAEPGIPRVALTLCNVVLSRCRNEDVLIFHSILEAPLPVLRRRGYNVDRILNQQKTERLARIADMEQAKERERLAVEQATEQAMVVAGNAKSNTGRPTSSISEKSTTGSIDTKPADELSLRSSGIMNQLKARFKQQQPSGMGNTSTSAAMPTPNAAPPPVNNSNEVRGTPRWLCYDAILIDDCRVGHADGEDQGWRFEGCGCIKT